jgi:hypothetical protein
VETPILARRPTRDRHVCGKTLAAHRARHGSARQTRGVARDSQRRRRGETASSGEMRQGSRASLVGSGRRAGPLTVGPGAC